MKEVESNLKAATKSIREARECLHGSGHEKSFLEKHGGKIHTGLGVLGFVPVVGTFADIADAGVYLAEGKTFEAGVSIVAAVPGVGDTVKGGKIAKTVIKEVGEEATEKVGKETTKKVVIEIMKEESKEPIAKRIVNESAIEVPKTILVDPGNDK